MACGTVEIVQHRLADQSLSNPGAHHLAEVVRWLGAVQAQDFGDAKWALAQRTQGLTDVAVERVTF